MGENTAFMFRRLPLLVALALGALSVAIPTEAWADSTEAYCVLSKPKSKSPPLQGPCRWSQRQGNVNIVFQSQNYDFPADQDGRTYTRLNREGSEAGPVFTRKGLYTLSVYWRKPAGDLPGF